MPGPASHASKSTSSCWRSGHRAGSSPWRRTRVLRPAHPGAGRHGALKARRAAPGRRGRGATGSQPSARNLSASAADRAARRSGQHDEQEFHLPGGPLIRRGAVLGLAAALGSAAVAGPPAAAAVAASGDWRLVELVPPSGGFDAGVMDIEVVGGMPTYDPNYHVVEGDGEQHQRAVVWRGLEGAPQRVDPGLAGVEDIAFDLTPNGLAPGETWFRDRPVASWVHGPATGTTTVVSASAVVPHGRAPCGSDASTPRARRSARGIRATGPGDETSSRRPCLGPQRRRPPAPAHPWRGDRGDGLNEHGDPSGFIGMQDPGVCGWST